MDSKGLRVGIISGVISSLIVLFLIQPILSITWKAIVAVGGFVHQGYVDRIYRNAATFDSGEYGRYTLFVVFTICLFGIMYWYGRRLQSDPHAFLFPRFVRVLVSFNWVVTALIAVVIFGKVAILEGTLEISESFKQRLTVLAPAVSDTEYKTLKARWAGMQGKADYDALVTSMDKRAAELGVKLPAVRKP